MNRGYLGLGRRTRRPDNPFWKDITHAHNSLDKLTAKEQNFIQDMRRKGPDHIMTEPQIRWLSSGIMPKVYK